MEDSSCNCHEIDNFSISAIYFFLENYKKASSLVAGYDFELTHFKEASYSLFIENTDVYYEKINYEIKENKEMISEIKNNTDGWEKETETQKEFSLKDAQDDIKKHKKLTEEFKRGRPKVNLSSHVTKVYCGCLLFGCETHGNQAND